MTHRNKRDFAFFSIRCIYTVLIISIAMGMIYQYSKIHILYSIYIIMRVFLLIMIVINNLFRFIFNPRLHNDSIIIGAFVLWELYVSKANNLIVMPYFFLDVFIWPGLYITFKEYTKKEPIKEELYKPTKYAIAILLVLSLPLIYKHRLGMGNAGGVVFYVYYCITFIPLIIYTNYDRKKVTKLFIVIILITLLSTKRSGTIVAIIGFIIYIFSDLNVRNDIKNKMEKKFYYVISGVVLSICVLVANEFLQISVLNRIGKLKEDQGSARLYIWNYIGQSFQNSDIKKQFMGHGFQSVYYQLKPFGVERLAHNSFLEFLYDYGYIGLGIFVIWFILMIKKCVSLNKAKYENSSAFIIAIFISLFLASTSYYFEESVIINPIALFLGCVVGDEYRNKYEKRNMV